MSIYEGLVICHPKEHCSTWDFCTHYIPHVKGDACSCDSCVPCDTKTVLEHRVKIKEANIAARDKWWIERIQKEVFDGGCYILRADTKATCERCGEYSICHMVKWQQLKREVGQ